MIRRKIILADEDSLYIENISNYMMEKHPQLELNIFTRKDSLVRYLEGGGTADILILDEKLADLEMEKHTGDMVRILLSASMTPVPGYELVRKYQKTESLLNEIMLKYAEQTGSADALRGNQSTRMVAFYSPAGGTGKTSLALALSMACAREGKKTFYLNLEEIGSVQEILNSERGNLSDVFFALKTKGMNVAVKLASCVEREKCAGFYFLAGVESVSEYEEITGEEVKRFLQELKSLAEYDLIVVDLSSGFSELTRSVLGYVDDIFVPVLPEETSVSKIRHFLNEARIHEKYDSVIQKMTLIVNRAEGPGLGPELKNSGILEALPCCASVGDMPVFRKKEGILASGERLRNVMAPLIQMINGPEEER